MTRQEFDVLVRQVESGIGCDPDKLRKKVASLAIIGFAGVLMPLVLVLIFASAFIIPQLLWAPEAWGLSVVAGLILFFGGWLALRPLLVRLPPPEGRNVTRAEAPALFATLDALRTELRSARFHHVLFIPECNAAVIQRPRLGVFGWYCNYLLIGLPLMEALSKDEFRSVMAHEFAHLSRQHGKSSQWIYRLRRSWEPVFTHLSRPRMPNEISLRPLIRKFLNWHWPRFNAHAFVLSRAHEYLADAEAARIVGAPTSASALMRLDICGDALDKTIWPEIWKQSATVPTPPTGVFERIQNSFTELSNDPRTNIQRVLLETTTNADTHPCLSDRLRAIGQLPSDRTNVQLCRNTLSAAEVLLGATLPQIRSDVEKAWQKKALENWTLRHSRANALSDRLQTIDQTTASRAADAGAVWDKACVVAQLQGDDAAAPLLKQVLELDPNHALANFNLGQTLLKKCDSEGKCYLERAIAANEELLPKAANHLHQYYRQIGQADKIQALYARLDQFEKVMAESRTERSNVTAKDTFLPHDLTEAQLQTVRDVLASESDIVEAHLAQKQMKHLVNQRLYVLAVRIRSEWHRLPNEEKQQAVIARISKRVQVPGRILIIPPNGPFGALARKVRTDVSARIFPC